MSTSPQHFAPGTYKFTVSSAEQAVSLIREKLGPNARVLSVRSVAPTGFRKFFSTPRLEVVAQVDAAPVADVRTTTPESAAADRSYGSDRSHRTDEMPPATNRLTQFPPSL